MRVVDYYYLSYPDCRPAVPEFASTEMWVEIGEEGDTHEHHQGTYAFQVYTFQFLQREYVDRGKPLAARSVMIVPTLADDWVSAFLDSNVDSLAKWGELK